MLFATAVFPAVAKTVHTPAPSNSLITEKDTNTDMMQPPGEDGICNQVADRCILNPVQKHANFAGMAALKVLKLSLGIVPTETQSLRADQLSHRENPSVEIEMMAVVASSPNADPEKCLYTFRR